MNGRDVTTTFLPLDFGIGGQSRDGCPTVGQYLTRDQTRYICHRLRNQVGKETKRFRVFVVFGVLEWMPADVQMNHGSSIVHAQWFFHWKIRADDHDIISQHHEDLSCYRGREL